MGKRDQDGELRQAGTPRKDVRQDADGDGREDNCSMLNTCEVCAAECRRGGGKPAGDSEKGGAATAREKQETWLKRGNLVRYAGFGNLEHGDLMA